MPDLTYKIRRHLPKGLLKKAAIRGWFPLLISILYLYNFPYFRAIHSANELPRIYLTMAIVDRGALNIDPELRRFQFSPDTSTYKGKLYSNKAPGISLLTIPVYWIQKKANGGKTPKLMRMFFWFRIFGSMVPSLLFLLLLWRFLKRIIDDEGGRRIVLAAYALGTMAMTYGTLFIAHQLSALLMATGYILIHLHARGEGNRWWPGLAGVAAGAGVLVDYQVAFIGPPLFLYLLIKVRPALRSAIFFAVGAAIPLIVLLIYHWGCFDDPFKTGYHYPTTKLFQEWHKQGFLGMKAFTYKAFKGSFWRPDNGLFYFSPFLILAFPGLLVMAYKKDLWIDALLCAGLIVFFGYFISSLTFWRSGWAVGPRYITCAIPYYLVPIAVLVGSTRKLWFFRIVPFGLMAVSILIYVTANAVFPHYPENFSNPWFDLTLRFGRAGYLPYNLGWKLGLRGLASVIPYLVLLGILLITLLFLGTKRLWNRVILVFGSLVIVFGVLVYYHHQLADRRIPVPIRFLPWMERIWEPRHKGMDLRKLLPAKDPRTGSLETQI